MNFILVGDDCAALTLLRAIAASPQHALTHAAECNALASELLRLAPRVRIGAGWEEALSAQAADGAIVAGSEPAVLEAARQFAAAGVPLAIFPAARQQSTFIYELTLIRDASGAVLMPAVPLLLHPLVCRLREVLDSGELGRVTELRLEREWRGETKASAFTVEERDAVLLPDAVLLRHFGGDYDQVTALHSGGRSEGAMTLATVALSGGDLPPAAWSLRLSPSVAQWSLTVVGDERRAVLCGQNLPDLRLDLGGGAEAPEAAPAGAAVDEDIGRRMLEQFQAALAGAMVRPNWRELTRAFETVDAAHDSVRRRRTIDLHFDATSERSVFKTQMTAVGCMLLTATFLAVLLLLAVGAAFDHPAVAAALRVARIAVFVPLLVFLVLQGLLLFTRPSHAEGSPAAEKSLKDHSR